MRGPPSEVEVTSKSTEAYDRGEKLGSYKRLESLRSVLIVSHRERRVTVVERGDGADWSERDVHGGQQVTLPVLGASFPVDALYDGIDLGPV